MKKLKKFIKYMIEARFLKKFFEAMVKFIKKFHSHFMNAVDWTLAIPTRYLLSATSKVQKNKIMFMTFNHEYACNPKYICEEILRQNLPVELVWAVLTPHIKKQKIDKTFPGCVKLVVRGTYAFFKELATSKVWIDNAFVATWNPLPKKKEQFYIQTWHGSLGLKRIDNASVGNRRWSLASRLNSKMVDVCMSNSTFETGVFRETHWPKNKILELGHARNDILFADEATKVQIKEKVFRYFNIAEGTKLALYAPTFRENDVVGVFDLDRTRFLNALQKRFGGEWLLLNRFHMKTHKGRKGLTAAMEEDPRIVSAAKYPDIQELMVAADVGISDYSSWICDFFLTGRPAFLYAPDLENYDQERGFYYPLSETPSPIAQTNDELEEKVLGFAPEVYAEKTAQFLKARGSKEQGTASRDIVEIIKQQCGLA